MAQVLLPPQKDKMNLLDAVGRALQGYQAFTGAQQNNAQKDYLEQKTSQEKADSDALNAGQLTKAKAADLATKGVTYHNEPVEGGFQSAFTDAPDVPIYLKFPTNKAELETPLQSLQRQKLEKELKGEIPLSAKEKAQLDIENRKLGLLADKQNQEKGSEKKSKVTSQTAQEIGNYDAAQDIADLISQKYNALASTGGSSFKQFIPGADANLYNKDRNTAAQTIGTILEKGKLTDADYPKYINMLPGPTDTNEVASEKINAIKQLIAVKKKAEISGLSQANFDTSGFAENQTPGQVILGNKKKSGGFSEATASPSAKPKQVIQDGHTYNLNEKTGKYE